MALENNKGNMQKYCEASTGCLQNNVFPGNLHYQGNRIHGFFQRIDGITTHSGSGNMDPKDKFSQTSFTLPVEGYRSPMHHQDFETWPAFHPEFHKAHQNQLYALEAQHYPLNYEYGFPTDNRFQYVPFRMSSQSYLPDARSQEFQYFVVIDFEATCDRDKNPHPQEIIEFPSVLVNSMTGELEDCFQIYVRPTYNQLLSDFCKELTGIQQTQVDRGVLLSEALLMHDKWLEEKGIKHTNFAVVTWSNWDCRVMLESECRFKKIRKPPYFNRWINLKVPFQEVFGADRCNLKEAVQLAGLVWEGRAHCGLDDAKNTARLLTHLMHRGFKFTITNTLMWASAECPLAMRQFLDSCSSSIPQLPKVKQPLMPLLHFQPVQTDPTKDHHNYCYCGVKSNKRMVRKPGPKHGSFFFGCGNWTSARGALCPYFEWATP